MQMLSNIKQLPECKNSYSGWLFLELWPFEAKNCRLCDFYCVARLATKMMCCCTCRRHFKCHPVIAHGCYKYHSVGSCIYNIVFYTIVTWGREVFFNPVEDRCIALAIQHYHVLLNPCPAIQDSCCLFSHLLMYCLYCE